MDAEEEAAAEGADEGEAGEDGEDAEEEWFDAYDDVEVHRIMVADRERCQAYARAIEAAAPHIRGKTVVDVGSGTGILSLLCARAGAKKARSCARASARVHARTRAPLRRTRRQRVVLGCPEQLLRGGSPAHARRKPPRPRRR